MNYVCCVDLRVNNHNWICKYGWYEDAKINYIEKFITLTEKMVKSAERKRFLNDVQNLTKLKSGNLHKLNIEVDKRKLKKNNIVGIF